METLRVGTAFPDPPFNGMPDGGGLDIDLMTEIAKALGLAVEFIAYDGADFNGIFDALDAGAYDCVTSGTTVTPDREKKVSFCRALSDLRAVAGRGHHPAAASAGPSTTSTA